MPILDWPVILVSLGSRYSESHGSLAYILRPCLKEYKLEGKLHLCEYIFAGVSISNF